MQLFIQTFFHFVDRCRHESDTACCADAIYLVVLQLTGAVAWQFDLDGDEVAVQAAQDIGHPVLVAVDGLNRKGVDALQVVQYLFL